MVWDKMSTFVPFILPLSLQQRPLALLGLAKAPRGLGYQGKQDNGNNCASNLAPCLSGAGNRSHRDNVGLYKGMAIGQKRTGLLFFSLIGPRSCLRSQCGAVAKSGASHPGSKKKRSLQVHGIQCPGDQQGLNNQLVERTDITAVMPYLWSGLTLST